MADTMAVGFTGTRHGLGGRQTEALRSFLASLNAEACGLGQRVVGHHGCCLGADESFAVIARELGWYMIGYPSNLDSWVSKMAVSLCDEVEPPAPPLERNSRIVQAAFEAASLVALGLQNRGLLVVAPHELREILGSGTWSTVRRARKAGLERFMIWPTGKVEQESHG